MSAASAGASQQKRESAAQGCDPGAGRGGSPVGGPAATRLRARRLVTLAVAAAGLAVWLGAGVGAGRLHKAEEARHLVAGRRSEGEAIAAALGGFRGLVSDFLWLRVIQMQDKGLFDEITLLCKLILDVQPRFTSVWRYMSWNLAYNLAYETSTPEERWRWIDLGIDLLANDKNGGVVRNPGDWEIYEELGHTYYFRVSKKGSDPFYRYYQEQIAPVPRWCEEQFDFVDQGLWVVVPGADRALPERYRLYRKRLAAGRVRLGSASGDGGYPTRARRMFLAAVTPAEALTRASVVRNGRREDVTAVRLAPGVRLYSDLPSRVATTRFRAPKAGEAEEDPMPDELVGAALVPLPDADRTLESEDYLDLELADEATVWVGWPADEHRNFEIARGWLKEAERLSHGRMLRVSRLRIHSLADMGRPDEAYEEFRELMRSRPAQDTSVPDTLKIFLLQRICESFVQGDQGGLRKWHGRLRAEFPDWTMPPVETAEFAARILGVSLPRKTREE